MLAVMSTEVFGIILAGYGSGSKWALFGGMREAAQMVSYEVPMALCVLVPVIVAGSMDLNYISNLQDGGIWNWYVFHDPFTFFAFWTYFTCATAQCKRAPFDLAEAESELVAGFHTEYSGLRWSFFFMAEYGAMFAVSGIAVMLFLGGWHTGFLPELSTTFAQPGWAAPAAVVAGLGLGNVINVVVFVLKGWLLVFVQMWVRWTLPRLAHRSGDDDLPEISAADQLRAAAGRQSLAGGRLARGRPVFQLCAVRRAAWLCSRWMVVKVVDDAEPAAGAGDGRRTCGVAGRSRPNCSQDVAIGSPERLWLTLEAEAADRWTCISTPCCSTSSPRSPAFAPWPWW